jgi:hypothetical protein
MGLREDWRNPEGAQNVMNLKLCPARQIRTWGELQSMLWDAPRQSKCPFFTRQNVIRDVFSDNLAFAHNQHDEWSILITLQLTSCYHRDRASACLSLCSILNQPAAFFNLLWSSRCRTPPYLSLYILIFYFGNSTWQSYGIFDRTRY